MSDQNTPAPAHEIRFSDDQLMSIATAAWEVHSDEAYSPDGLLMACVAVQAALLSKLRAPVADERAAFEYHARACELTRDEDEPDEYRNSYVQEYWNGWKARSALASAPDVDEAKGQIEHLDIDNHRLRRALASVPVAGEAKPAIILKAVDEYGPQLGWTKHWVEYPIGTKFYAAPQASEAVRDAARLDYLESLREQAKAKRYQWDGWRFYALQNDLTIRQQLDAALSAQPGAQKDEK